MRITTAMAVMLTAAGLTAVRAQADAEPNVDPNTPKLLFIDWGSVYDHLGMDDPRHPITVAGRVVIETAATDTAATKPLGIAGVAVSDGRQVVTTASDGSFRLHGVIPGLQRFVFVSVPTGYRAGNEFHRRIPLETDDMTADFKLNPDPASLQADHTFIQITDAHGSPGFVKELTPNLGAFAILTGDIVNCPYDQTHFLRVRDAMKQSAIPVLPLPGNHDLLRLGSGEVVTREMLRARRDATAKTATPDPGTPDVAVYEDVFGPSYYSFNYGGRHYILLMSTAERDRQQEWMRNDIAVLPEDTEILVFQHYPPNPDQMAFYKQFNVRAVFSGHNHADHVFQYGSILNVTTMAMSHSRDFSPQTIRVVKFEGADLFLENHTPGFGDQADIPALEATPGAAQPIRVATDWPFFQATPARTGVARDRLAPPLAVAWTQALGGAAHVGAPLAAGGLLYVGLKDKTNRGHAGVVALDPASGEIRWRYPTVSGATMAFTDDTLYAAIQDGSLHAIDPKTGERRWKTRLEDPILYRLFSPPAVWNDFVMAGNGKHFAALDKTSGQTAWRLPDLGAGFWANFAAPAVANNRVAIMVPGRGLIMIDAASGTELWRAEAVRVDTRNPFTPVIHKNTVYAPSHRGLHAIDAANGQTRWTAQTFGTPAVDEEGVYVGARQGFLKLDPETGEPIWTHTGVTDLKTQKTLNFYFSTPVFAAPVLSGDYVHVATTSGFLLSINRATGKTESILELGMPLVASPAISGNALFLVSYNGTVLALSPEQ